MIICNAKMSTANTQGTGGGERNMQMNSSSTRFLVACRDAGIARAGISPRQSQKQSAASSGPSAQPATSHSESNRVSGAYLRAFALDMNRRGGA